AEVVRKCVDDRSTNTSARSAPSNNERVRSRIDKIACEWRTEERARMLLGDQDVLRLRRNVRNELVSLCGYTHQCRHFIGEATRIKRLFRSHIRIQHRPVLTPKYLEQPLNVGN